MLDLSLIGRPNLGKLTDPVITDWVYHASEYEEPEQADHEQYVLECSRVESRRISVYSALLDYDVHGPIKSQLQYLRQQAFGARIAFTTVLAALRRTRQR